MDYADLLKHAVRVLWQRKHLMALGIVFVIVTGGGRVQDRLLGLLIRQIDLSALPGGEMLAGWLPSGGQDLFARIVGLAAQNGLAGWAGLIAAALTILIALGMIAIVTLGGMIDSAGKAEMDGTPGFRSALAAGWRRAWRLIIIASIPPIPVTIAVIFVVVLSTVVIRLGGGLEVITRFSEAQRQIVGGLALASILILLPFLVATFALSLLSSLAYRACVLEGRRAIEAYRRGWEMLRANVGSAAVLALLHLIIESVIGSVLIVPGLLALYCFALTPLLWFVYGVQKAFFVTLWTLAWQRWTTRQASSALAD